MSDLYNAIFKGDLNKAKVLVQEAIDRGETPQSIIDENMVPAMEGIGKEFEAGKVFVPNLLLSARAMKGSLELLKPLLQAGMASNLGKVVIGTVKGDLHDIGKNLVASMLEGCGFEVINLGVDIPKERFVQTAKDQDPDIVCLSALLTTTMSYMKEVIDALHEAGVRAKIMVGGAPVNKDFADQIGADAYSSNANEAVEVAKGLLA